MTEHPLILLSAYLDGALAPDERATVHAHIDGCGQCRSRLEELRATSRLIATLPVLAPARSLRPPVQRGWLWLRPVRLLSSIGTGAFLFLFLASYVVNSGSSLGGGTSTSETLAAQGKFGAAASAAAAENAQKRVSAGAPTPAAAAAPNLDSSRGVAAGPGPSGQVAVATGAVTTINEPSGRQVGPPPALFLAVALLFAIMAFVAHRRLRRA